MSTTGQAVQTRALTPGLLVAATGTAVAFQLASLVPALSALTAAVVLGAAVGGMLPEETRAGMTWAARKCLRLGVVLLGLQLGLGEVLGLGAGTVAAVVATVLATFAGTLLLGRLLSLPPGLTLMVATGFSICGASAIAAMDSVTDTDKEEVATAVTLVTLYGSAAIAFLPYLGQALALSPEHLGTWAGISVHEVAQVVAAASPAGPGAVAIAVVVKLTRVVLLAPMVAGAGALHRRRTATPGHRPPLVPLFVAGFLATMLLRTTGTVPPTVLTSAKTTTTLLFTAALFALGSGVRLGALLRTGRRGLLLGALSTALVTAVGYGSLRAAGAL
ncbi:putative sulfate exporter family transporter [Streptomyces sp. V2]|uniref:YeiH family protein n=2 Tax=Streptomyces TaxID=1883 RepID=UPI000D66BD95|nr:putative sulfate exporter family transporter [Streptomyces sp. V2]PWG14364.1 putative sulfate exporter family transporter [Streptomyces sp. V2]